MPVVKIQLNFHPVEENYQLQILKFSISDFNYDRDPIKLNRLNDNCIEFEVTFSRHLRGYVS